ncbi:hypothetical protein MAC_04448 [Metarhizium acridum CQMa 102]|uniref:Uncharacterized protein n=1 Tax=Metarhizium acridum (strain CQMa 102) TaxID=655827 RepID=E9E3K0_METAQ|nr:uncharacterized protein MAC_04448 [Metarhizium acridum CQMa 102]EFY89593.1 hypothetical protein MAC_04448 [Metarhizium acridum CQMa 102]
MTKTTKTIMAADDLMYLGSSFQRPADLQQTSSVPQSDPPSINGSYCTQPFRNDCDSREWKFGDEVKTICPASLHFEGCRLLATDTPFLPDHANDVPINDDFNWLCDTPEQDFNYEPEEDECSWLEIAELVEIFYDSGSPGYHSIGPTSKHMQSRGRTENLCRHTPNNITHGTSTLASSTPSTSSFFTEAHAQDHSTPPESRHPEIGSSSTFSREAMKNVQVIDLTGDDNYPLLEPLLSPTHVLPKKKPTARPHAVINLTQYNLDKDDEKMKA